MSKFRKALVNNKGFTLIELLVVIAVLGILAAIAIPRLSGVTNQAKMAELKSTGSSLRSAIEMYIAENNTFPSSDGSSFDWTTSNYNIGINLDEYDVDSMSEGVDTYSVTISPKDGPAGASVTVTQSSVTATM